MITCIILKTIQISQSHTFQQHPPALAPGVYKCTHIQTRLLYRMGSHATLNQAEANASPSTLWPTTSTAVTIARQSWYNTCPGITSGFCIIRVFTLLLEARNSAYTFSRAPSALKLPSAARTALIFSPLSPSLSQPSTRVYTSPTRWALGLVCLTPKASPASRCGLGDFGTGKTTLNCI